MSSLSRSFRRSGAGATGSVTSPFYHCGAFPSRASHDGGSVSILWIILIIILVLALLGFFSRGYW
jgi:hypothetical protein